MTIKYFDAAACASLRQCANASGNVAAAVRLMQAGALLSANMQVAAELQEMAITLDKIAYEVERCADDLDPMYGRRSKPPAAPLKYKVEDRVIWCARPESVEAVMLEDPATVLAVDPGGARPYQILPKTDDSTPFWVAESHLVRLDPAFVRNS